MVDVTKLNLGMREIERTGRIQDYFKHHIPFNLGTLPPVVATIQHREVPCDTNQQLIRFRVDWIARNGRWMQYIELKRNGDRYDFYTAVERDGDWIFENPPRESIPKRADGKPDVFWHTGIAEALGLAQR